MRWILIALLGALIFSMPAQAAKPCGKPGAPPCPTPTPTPTATATPTPTPPPTGWTTVLSEDFNDGVVDTAWHRYDGPYGSDPFNCAHPSQVTESGGSMHLWMTYRADLPACGGTHWYTAGMQLDAAYASVNQAITVRFRVVNTDFTNVRAHRNMPMHFGDTQPGGWPGGGEIDYCEGSAVTDCSMFLHWRDMAGTVRQYTGPDNFGDFTQFQTVRAERLNHVVSVYINGVLEDRFTGDSTSVPDVVQRAVLQQECRTAGCPPSSESADYEDIQVDWITVENRT